MFLSNNKRFLEEYKNFNERIRNITDSEVKRKASALLIEFYNEVKIIDQHHLDLIYQPKIAETISESREILRQKKSQLTKLLKSWENSLDK